MPEVVTRFPVSVEKSTVSIAHRIPHKATRFALLTIVSLTTNLSIAYGLFYAGVPEALAFASALLTAFALNFAGCRWFVFLSTDTPLTRQLLHFALTNGSFRLLEYLSLLALSAIGFSNYYIRVITVLAISFVLKFFVYGKFVFGQNRPS
ncbi:MAG: hypothetical protein CME32_30370 [Gimesia sp.]|nr:hypothetical protein [Gimesia sp.]